MVSIMKSVREILDIGHKEPDLVNMWLRIAKYDPIVRHCLLHLFGGSFYIFEKRSFRDNVRYALTMHLETMVDV